MERNNNEFKNHLNEVPLANITNEELNEIKKLENKLNDKYYLIAFKRDEI